MPYAEGTSVSVENSRAELDRLLGKHGATQRAIATDDLRGLAAVIFTLASRQYRMEIPLPSLESVAPKRIQDQPRGWPRMSPDQQTVWIRREHEQRCRERWRAVVLLIKAKLELVASSRPSYSGSNHLRADGSFLMGCAQVETPVERPVRVVRTGSTITPSATASRRYGGSRAGGQGTRHSCPRRATRTDHPRYRRRRRRQIGAQEAMTLSPAHLITALVGILGGVATGLHDCEAERGRKWQKGPRWSEAHLLLDPSGVLDGWFGLASATYPDPASVPLGDVIRMMIEVAAPKLVELGCYTNEPTDG